VSRLAPALFAALLFATVVVAAIVVHARTPDLELEVTHLTRRISPAGQRDHRVAHIRFFVRESEPDATVQIVGPNLTLVRTLYRGPLAANREVSLAWNGRDRLGQIPNPDHRYRLRVILPSRDRDMVYPRRIDVVEPPGS
jgi:hypothetical protein